MNNIQIFNNPQFGEVRVTEVNGEPLFCLTDVARCLGYSNPAKAVIDHCKGVTVLETPTNGGIQQMKYGKESDVYRLIMSSRLSDAEIFQDWVFDDVLPTIRKHGAYLSNEAIEKTLTDPDYLIQLATALKAEKQKRLELEETTRLQSEQLMLSAPKVQYCDTVLKSVNTYNVNLIAKELGMSAESLNRLLSKMGIIYRQGGMWILTSKYQDKGYTKTRTTTYTRSDGSIGTSMLMVWTEKGRQFIHEQFNSSLS